MTKNYVCCAPYIRNHTYMIVICFTQCKIIISSVLRVKGQKMVQIDKKLLCLISQEPCIIWSSFMVHTCKRIISPVFNNVYLRKHTSFIWLFFHYFKCTFDHDFWYVCVKWFFLKNLIFGVVRGVIKNGKKWPIITNFSLSHSISQEL